MKKIPQYQGRDADVVDYELFELPEVEYLLRGPRPVTLTPNRYGAVIGAGQSFGVLVREPYVHQLQGATGLPLLNLSVGGASPDLYLRNPAYLRYVNSARFCIVQVMSARGSRNSYFEARHGKNMLRRKGSSEPFVPGDTAFTRMLNSESQELVEAVIGELRANWTKEMIQLLSRIKVPTILLWFSKRKPEYVSRGVSFREYAGAFPQFVTHEMVAETAEFADAYVEVVTSRGMPNKLTNRFTGASAMVALGDGKELRAEDNYYPSPEMHMDAFEALLPVVLKNL